MKTNKICLKITFLSFLILLWTGCSKNPTKKITQMKGSYICISLVNYMTAITEKVSTHEALPPDFERLFGMSWIDGYVLDPKNDDIILVGKVIKDRPTYHTEDLLVNMHNVFDSAIAPYCSLDPKPDNIRRLNEVLSNQSDDFETTIRNCRNVVGSQRVVIGGVPKNSRHAKIMIYADYDMKKLSQGLIKIPGIRSCIDIAMTSSQNSDLQGSTMSRFWFHIKEGKDGMILPNYIENDGIVFINECPVVVLTEKQMVDADGNTADNTSENDADADTFALELSHNYGKISRVNSLFAELENLFRLQACLKSMKFKDAISESQRDILLNNGLKLSPGDDLPAGLPGLVNFKLLDKEKNENGTIQRCRQLYLVCGGVNQEMVTNENNFTPDPLISKPKTVIINSRPKNSTINWTAQIY